MSARARMCKRIHSWTSVMRFFSLFIACERIRALSRMSVVLQIVQLIGEMTALGIAPSMLLMHFVLDVWPRHFRYLKGRKSLNNLNVRLAFPLMMQNILLAQEKLVIWLPDDISSREESNRFHVTQLRIQREAISSCLEIYDSATVTVLLSRFFPSSRIIYHATATILTAACIVDERE